jgi:hypothetical protein
MGSNDSVQTQRPAPPKLAGDAAGNERVGLVPRIIRREELARPTLSGIGRLPRTRG